MPADADQILYGDTSCEDSGKREQCVDWSVLVPTSILIEKLDKEQRGSRISLAVASLLEDLERLFVLDPEHVNITYLDLDRYDTSPCIHFEFSYHDRDQVNLGFPAVPLDQVRAPDPMLADLENGRLCDDDGPLDWLAAIDLLATSWALLRRG